MSNFALNSTDPQSDIISSINYLLATQGNVYATANANVNLGNVLVANVSNGEITTAADPNYLAYLYRYLAVRYADSADGTVNFSTSPTNRLYFGVRNINTSNLTVDTYTTSGTWTAPVGISTATVFMVGGGGAGGSGGQGGGGGGGGVVYTTANVIPGASYTITIGAGGTPSLSAQANGSPTTFAFTSNSTVIYTAMAGGGGGGELATNTASVVRNGGSGGGGSHSYFANGINGFNSGYDLTSGNGIQNSTYGYGSGNNGGLGRGQQPGTFGNVYSVGYILVGGGGGGANAAGGNWSLTSSLGTDYVYGGDGGDGYTANIGGSNISLGGGGGGGIRPISVSPVPGSGGVGGGQSAVSFDGNVVGGATINSGGGGAGVSRVTNGGPNTGGAGGSGVFYIVYGASASSNPADYVWTQVVGGFGTTNFLFYQTIGGRQINYSIGPAAPSANFVQTVDDTPIDLDLITGFGNGAPGTDGITPPTIVQTWNFGQTIVQQSTGSAYPYLPQPAANGLVQLPTTITAQEGNVVVAQINRVLNFDSNNALVAGNIFFPNGSIANSSITYNSGNAVFSNYNYQSNVSGYSYYTFQTNNIGYLRDTVYSFTVAGGSLLADLLMVGAGGSGGPTYAGNGGEVKLFSNIVIPTGTYTVQVGGNDPGFPTITTGNSIVTIGSTIYRANVGGSTTGAGGFGAGGAGGVNDGGVGVPDPWNTINWLSAGSYTAGTNNGLLYVGGTAYFGGGGGYGYGSLGGYGAGGGRSAAGQANIGEYGGGASHTGPGGVSTQGSNGLVVLRFAANQQNLISNLWTITNTGTDINANAFTIGTPYYTTTNYYTPVTFTSANGNAAGSIAATVTPRGNTGATGAQGIQGNTGPQGIQGNTGPAGANGSRGFVPLAYVVTSSDPTGYSSAQYTAAFSAPRANTVPPIGTGFTPITGDTAQFVYTTTNAYVVKTYDANTAVWTTANGQVIDGNLIVTGTITANQLAANDIYALTIKSTNANVGNVSSTGFWLASNTGDARFGGNLSVGNNANIGSNLIVGDNANIGANLYVAGLITTGNLNNSTVATGTIQSNAVSFFTGYQNNAELVTLSPTPNTFYSLTNTISVTTTVTNTKVVVTGQALNITVANTASATDSWTSNMGIRMFDSSANVTYILTSEAKQFTPGSAGNLLQGDHAYYETGVVLTLTNIATYSFGVYGYVQTSGNTVVVATDALNRRNAVQSLKR